MAAAGWLVEQKFIVQPPFVHLKELDGGRRQRDWGTSKRKTSTCLGGDHFQRKTPLDEEFLTHGPAANDDATMGDAWEGVG